MLGEIFIAVILPTVIFLFAVHKVKKYLEKEPKKVSYEEFLLKQAETKPEFKTEAEYIKKLIIEYKYEDINEIKEKLSITAYDCINRIDYLRKVTNELNGYYLDYYYKTIKKCNEEEYKLLDKYVGYIYNDKLQMEQIAQLIKRTSPDDLYIIRQQTRKDIKYLISKELVDGVTYNETEDKIIRLNLKKSNLISANCPSCGAVNDVKEGRKGHCKYCNAIIKTHIK